MQKHEMPVLGSLTVKAFTNKEAYGNYTEILQSLNKKTLCCCFFPHFRKRENQQNCHPPHTLHLLWRVQKLLLYSVQQV